MADCAFCDWQIPKPWPFRTQLRRIFPARWFESTYEKVRNHQFEQHPMEYMNSLGWWGSGKDYSAFPMKKMRREGDGRHS